MTNRVKSPYHLYEDNPFEMMLERVVGARVRADDQFAEDLWCALTQRDWRHDEDGIEVGYTFRAAACLVTALREKGQYTDWYCCGCPGYLSDEIQALLGAEGWVPKEFPLESAASVRGFLRRLFRIWSGAT